MKFAIALLVMMAMPVSAHAFGHDDHWVSGWGQGIAEPIITKGPGNQIYVTCDEGAGREATGISFMLGGKSPIDSSILLGFDKNDPEEFSLWDGAKYPPIAMPAPPSVAR